MKPEVHLWVLHHGLWGNPDHLTYLTEKITAKAADTGEAVEVMNIAANTGTFSYGGVDGCGAKAVHLVCERLADTHQPPVTHISFVGYSLGGLILRYAIGVLYAHGVFQLQDDTEETFPLIAASDLAFKRVIPVNFVTFASPHVGAVRETKSAFNSVFHSVGSVIIARSGAQMLLRDRSSFEKRRIVNVMADPDLPFWKGLKAFKRRALYGNLTNDFFVSHRTSTLVDVTPRLEPTQIKRLPQLHPEEYPSLVRIDELERANDIEIEEDTDDKKQATSARFRMAMIIFIPIGLTFLTFRRLFWSLLQVHEFSKVVISKKTTALNTNNLHNLGWLKTWRDKNGPSTTPTTPPIPDDGTWEYAFQQLNQLSWTRMHVRSEFRAHATIIRRAETSKGNEDVVPHYVDTVALFLKDLK
ncbi:hypothetical protein HDU78_006163 [Chytriomyces hyalinus]|nr:hypothetical protein HDU78_006163 [Chytriomyces hyalinus]